MHSIPSVRTYVTIWAILTFMTFLTYEVAQIDLGEWNVVVALLIAFFKMSLVVLFFMNLKAENRSPSCSPGPDSSGSFCCWGRPRSTTSRAPGCPKARCGN